MPLTTGTKPRTVLKFSTPLVGVTLHTFVASTVVAPTSASNDLRSYFLLSSRSYCVLTARPPWSASVLNRNTLPTMHDTELIRLS
ncbi:hypothetical protein A2U01_0056614, partial [Trifolium medium]|nr:hypothetical protein [Trifolium medium]